MKKKLSKTLILILCIILLGSVVSHASGATGTVEGFTGGLNLQGMNGEEGKKAIVKIVSTVLRLVRIAGTGIAVGVLMHISVKYIIASAGDRADIKKYAWNYVVGALVLFGASGIVSIAQKFVEEAFGTSAVGGA